jgi:hypothetical protein
VDASALRSRNGSADGGKLFASSDSPVRKSVAFVSVLALAGLTIGAVTPAAQKAS